MPQVIRYGGDDYLTADAVAEAVLDYAVALGGRGLMGVAELPVWLGDGSVGTARLVVGKDLPIATESVAEPASAIDGHPEAGASASRIRCTVVRLQREAPRFGAAPDREYALYDDL
jgi:hypothetical protein